MLLVESQISSPFVFFNNTLTMIASLGTFGILENKATFFSKHMNNSNPTSSVDSCVPKILVWDGNSKTNNFNYCFFLFGPIFHGRRYPEMGPHFETQ